MVGNTKTCTKCKVEKEDRFFYRRKSESDGKISLCMKCSRQKSQEWKVANREHVNAYARLRNADKKNRDYWKNKAPLKYLRSTAKANAKRTKKEFCLSNEYLYELWESQNGLCYYTNQPMEWGIGGPNKVSIDRFDSSKGYIESNVVLCRYKVNIMKNDLSLEMFVNIAEQVVTKWKSK
jgi:hypothetical protein